MQDVNEAVIVRITAFIISVAVVALGAQPLLKVTAGILS